MSNPSPLTPTQPLGDAESRHRDAVRILLKLRNESLMQAVAQGSKLAGVKLDYGNASAWMREIPGRFGPAKQMALLRYLGINGQRLDSSRLHFWFLPNTKDATAAKEMKGLWLSFDAEPSQYRWLRDSAGGFLGLAVQVAGGSIVFLPGAQSGRSEMEAWLAQFKWENQQPPLPDAGGIANEVWQKLRASELPPEFLWQPSDQTPTPDWQSVITFAIQSGFDPQKVKALLEHELRKDSDHYLLEAF
ncbi:MAG: hypothetical protein ACP5Q0_05455 [Halothiobacillus sp.]